MFACNLLLVLGGERGFLRSVSFRMYEIKKLRSAWEPFHILSIIMCRVCVISVILFH